MQQPIVVNGVNYHQKMPGNNKLTDNELTALINFVEFRFAKSTHLLSVDSVKILLKQ